MTILMKNRNGILQGPENKSVVQDIENTALQIFKRCELLET